MADVKLFDYTARIIVPKINEATLQWLEESANEIASKAQRDCKMDGDAGRKLRGSYTYELDRTAGKATIGTPHEEGYWEEFGTGEHAVDKSKSRQGWWVYTPDEPGPEGYKSGVYADETEAVAMAEHIYEKYGKRAIATNGRDPQHTLENSYKRKRQQIRNRLAAIVNEELGDK